MNGASQLKFNSSNQAKCIKNLSPILFMNEEGDMENNIKKIVIKPFYEGRIQRV